MKGGVLTAARGHSVPTSKEYKTQLRNQSEWPASSFVKTTTTTTEQDPDSQLTISLDESRHIFVQLL